MTPNTMAAAVALGPTRAPDYAPVRSESGVTPMETCSGAPASSFAVTSYRVTMFSESSSLCTSRITGRTAAL